MPDRMKKKILTEFAWGKDQKGRTIIIEAKWADEDKGALFRVWKPTHWKDSLPFDTEVGMEIKQETEQ